MGSKVNHGWSESLRLDTQYFILIAKKNLSKCENFETGSLWSTVLWTSWNWRFWCTTPLSEPWPISLRSERLLRGRKLCANLRYQNQNPTFHNSLFLVSSIIIWEVDSSPEDFFRICLFSLTSSVSRFESVPKSCVIAFDHLFFCARLIDTSDRNLSFSPFFLRGTKLL